MDKLKINLIPPEVREKAKKEAKRSVITRISVGLLGLLILVTAGVLAVTIYQNATLQSLNQDIENEKSNIGNLKEKEALAFFLRNRIDSIDKFASTQNTQSELFTLIVGLFPDNVNLISLQIDKSDKVVIQGETNSTAPLDVFFNRVIDPKTNEGKIASVLIDSLNKGQTGTIRFSITLSLNK